jgi:hypothetical protein
MLRVAIDGIPIRFIGKPGTEAGTHSTIRTGQKQPLSGENPPAGGLPPFGWI